ncbi:MAG TPA: class I SAM-dependent methyltransferase [Bacillaceae bacterium]
MEKHRLIQVFDRQANRYAKNKEGPVLKQWRQQLIGEAFGEVLELAVGAGANFPYYPSGVKLTAVDFSESMLVRARQAAKEMDLDVSFICADIEEVNFPDHSFDTIVSTLSFCSYGNPLKVLEKLNRWCKPHGKILLMEHGISSNRAVAAVQKGLNPLLYRMIGCHHTRDMPGLVQKAGIRVDHRESHWFNMMHIILARPGSQAEDKLTGY